MINITCDNCGATLAYGTSADEQRENIRAYTRKNGKQYCDVCAKKFSFDALPCPICGREPELDYSANSGQYVVCCTSACTNHSLIIRGDVAAKTAETAVVRWNEFAKRVAPKGGGEVK